MAKTVLQTQEEVNQMQQKLSKDIAEMMRKFKQEFGLNLRVFINTNNYDPFESQPEDMICEVSTEITCFPIKTKVNIPNEVY